MTTQVYQQSQPVSTMPDPEQTIRDLAAKHGATLAEVAQAIRDFNVKPQHYVYRQQLLKAAGKLIAAERNQYKRVVVTCADWQFNGQHGKVLSRHGANLWRVLLDGDRYDTVFFTNELTPEVKP